MTNELNVVYMAYGLPSQWLGGGVKTPATGKRAIFVKIKMCLTFLIGFLEMLA